MKLKSSRFAPIPAVIGLSAVALIALAMAHWTSLPFWAAFLIVVVGMVVNGIVAEHEDNAPGGFNNPHPPTPPDDSDRSSRKD
jgi:hypothetical protein